MKTPSLKIKPRHCLVQDNCLAVPAFAQAWVEVEDLDELQDALKLAQDEEWPALVMGSGSNIVLGDQLSGLVIHNALRGISVEERPGDKVRIRCASGENWHELVTYCVGRGYYGIENLALIPGTVGAAPIQNIGAYGVELDSVFQSLKAVEIATGDVRKFSRDDCHFAYRDSIFKNELRDRYIITEVCLELSKLAHPQAEYPSLASYLLGHSLVASPENIYAAVCHIRREKIPHPSEIPNVGSFFKNPVVSEAQAGEVMEKLPELPHWPLEDGRVKLSAAALIEAQGWKGKYRKGLGIHENHALILVNPGHESGASVLEFAAEIAKSIAAAYGIELQIEPRCYPD